MNSKPSLNNILDLKRRYLFWILTGNTVVGFLVSAVFYVTISEIQLSTTALCAVIIASSASAVSYYAFLKVTKKEKKEENISPDDITNQNTGVRDFKDKDAKDIFLDNSKILFNTANVSNQFRDPLTIIKNSINNIEKIRDLSNSTLEKNFSIIKNSTYTIDNLLKEIVYITNYDNRQLKLDFLECRLIDVYEKVKEQIDLLAYSRGKKVRTSIMPNLPKITIDGKSMGLVFYNLIDYISLNCNESLITINSKIYDGSLEIDINSKGEVTDLTTIQQILKENYNTELNQIYPNLYVCKLITESNNGRLLFENPSNIIDFKIIIPISNTNHVNK